MKTICRLADYEKGENISLYLFGDNTEVVVGDDKTVIGPVSAPELLIMDCTTADCVLHVDVEEPDNWYGWKYTYTPDDGWVIAESWPKLRKLINEDREVGNFVV